MKATSGMKAQLTSAHRMIRRMGVAAASEAEENISAAESNIRRGVAGSRRNRGNRHLRALKTAARRPWGRHHRGRTILVTKASGGKKAISY